MVVHLADVISCYVPVPMLDIETKSNHTPKTSQVIHHGIFYPGTSTCTSRSAPIIGGKASHLAILNTFLSFPLLEDKTVLNKELVFKETQPAVLFVLGFSLYKLTWMPLTQLGRGFLLCASGASIIFGVACRC